jgi:hypothetical protein
VSHDYISRFKLNSDAFSHFSTEANFTRHPLTIGALETVKLVRYQENPAHWGPGKKAKRKRSSEGLEEPPAKHRET